MTPGAVCAGGAVPDRVQRPRAPGSGVRAGAGADRDGDGRRQRRRRAPALESGAGAAAPMLRRAGSLVGDGSGTYSIDSRRTARDGRKASIAGRRARGRQRCAGLGIHGAATGRREHRRDDHCATASAACRARVGLGAGGLLSWWGALAGGRGCRARWRAAARAGPRSPAAAPDGDALAAAAADRDGMNDRSSATSAACPLAEAGDIDDDPLAARARRRASSTCRAGCCCRPAAGCAGAWSLPAAAADACATWSALRDRPADALRPPTASRSTRACSAGATPTASSMSNWSWCRAPRSTPRWRRSARSRRRWPASTSPTPTARRSASTCCRRRSVAQRRRSVARLELGAGRGRACSRWRWRCGRCSTTAAPPPMHSQAKSPARSAGARAQVALQRQQLIDAVAGRRLPRPRPQRPADRRSRSWTNSAAACPTTPIWKSSRSRTTACC